MLFFIPSHRLKIQLMALTYAWNSINYKTKNPCLIFFHGDILLISNLRLGGKKHKLSNIQSPEEPVSSPVCHLLPKEEKQEQKIE